MADAMLLLKLTEISGIQTYNFELDGVRVAFRTATEADLIVPRGSTKTLFWTMKGDSGSSMKVEVFDNGAILAQRLKSKIALTRTVGWDFLDLSPK